MGTMRWFGKAYDAPIWADMPEVPTPVGEECLHCGEPIAEGDAGLTIPAGNADGTWFQAPQHVECHLRMSLGSLAHLDKKCGCFTGDFSKPESSLPYREEARLVFQRWWNHEII